MFWEHQWRIQMVLHKRAATLVSLGTPQIYPPGPGVVGKERPSLHGKPSARAAGSKDDSWTETPAWAPWLRPGVQGGCVRLEHFHALGVNIFPTSLPHPEKPERDPFVPGRHEIMFTRGPFIKDIGDELKWSRALGLWARRPVNKCTIGMRLAWMLNLLWEQAVFNAKCHPFIFT